MARIALPDQREHARFARDSDRGACETAGLRPIRDVTVRAEKPAQEKPMPAACSDSRTMEAPWPSKTPFILAPERKPLASG